MQIHHFAKNRVYTYLFSVFLLNTHLYLLIHFFWVAHVQKKTPAGCRRLLFLSVSLTGYLSVHDADLAFEETPMKAFPVPDLRCEAAVSPANPSGLIRVSSDGCLLPGRSGVAGVQILALFDLLELVKHDIIEHLNVGPLHTG